MSGENWSRTDITRRLSERALLQLLPIFASFAQLGINPHLATNPSRWSESAFCRTHARLAVGGRSFNYRQSPRYLSSRSVGLSWSRQVVQRRRDRAEGQREGVSAYRGRGRSFNGSDDSPRLLHGSVGLSWSRQVVQQNYRQKLEANNRCRLIVVAAGRSTQLDLAASPYSLTCRLIVVAAGRSTG